MTEARDIIVLRMQNNKLSEKIITGGPILRVTCFPSGTELSLPYNEALILKRKLQLGELSLFLCPVLAIILKDGCLSNNAIEFGGANKRSVNIFMIEGRDRNIIRGKSQISAINSSHRAEHKDRYVQSLNQQPLEMCKVSVCAVFIYFFLYFNLTEDSLKACLKTLINLQGSTYNPV